MNLFRSLQTAFANLRANKLRSSLTMLGVIIGVSAVIIMVSIVEGARAQIVSEFERLGSKLIIIAYQPNKDDSKEMKRRLVGMTMDDVRHIQTECDLVESVSAELPMGGQTAHYLDREMDATTITGIQPDYRRLRNVTLKSGRFITEGDIADWSKVCVIGDKIKEELFKGQDPLGKTLEVQRVNLTIVGVQDKKGRSGPEGDADKNILIPISTLQKRLLGSELVGVVFAQPKSVIMLEATMDQIWQCLMRHHENAPGFRIDSQENILRTIGRILTIFSLIMGSIAGLSLLVGGIGIMNIMLVSVTERTREIGIRKAVGAKKKDILVQFLIESASVSGAGGAVGIGLGAAVAWTIHIVSKQFMKGGPGNGPPGLPMHLPMWSIVGAFAFSAFIGIFFGIYPAMRAAALDPIQALRHE